MQLIKLSQNFIILLLCLTVKSQSDSDFKASTIPVKLKAKANAVVRFDKQVIQVNAYDNMVITTTRIVTIFNEYGNRHQNAFEAYDSNTKIKKMEALIYDKSGNEIKKIKKKDFTDQSAVSDGTLYSDSRVKFLSYTPLNYPYTIKYSSEVEMKSTAFVPQWMPIDDYYVSVESSEYQIINNSDVKIRTKTHNFENFNVQNLGEIHYKITALEAVKFEAYNSGITNMIPTLKVALSIFNMEGVKGENNNWQDFGKWMYTKLIAGTDQIPESTIAEVKALTKNAKSNIEKAKIVYKYMQDKTRYISVQVGIGGWKPMDAMNVDKLGYSDCKGLTNYTKALLEAVGVPSYYTVVYGGNDIKNIDSKFSVTEGNHVILCLPTDTENIFLECTSQISPFGFTAGFTDDRDVLLITPEGGKIVHTKVYEPKDSQQITTANISLSDNGSFEAYVEINSTGIQYASHQTIEAKSPREQKLAYKNYWGNINNLNILSHNITNNKENFVFTEKLELNADGYASKSGNRLIIMPNLFNRVTDIPARYEERKSDFKLERGYKDVDEFIINLPEGVEVEAMSEGNKISSKFGLYQCKLEKIDDNQLKYSRSLTINKGEYTKEDYTSFRDFKKQIVKQDKTKIVLKINN